MLSSAHVLPYSSLIVSFCVERAVGALFFTEGSHNETQRQDIERSCLGTSHHPRRGKTVPEGISCVPSGRQPGALRQARKPTSPPPGGAETQEKRHGPRPRTQPRALISSSGLPGTSLRPSL